jgi:hypothetical protein
MRGINQNNRDLIEAVNIILAEDHPMTLRQVHYRVFSLANPALKYANEEFCYDRLGRVLTNARLLYRKSASGMMRLIMLKISDGTTAATRGRTSRIMSRSGARKLPFWGRCVPLCRSMESRFVLCRGYGSTGMVDQIGRAFEGIRKPIVVLYVGDHDPSGKNIPVDMQKRVTVASGRDFLMPWIAILPEDIKTFSLPSHRVKKTDTRAKGFKKEYDRTVELEALPVAELRRRLSVQIESLIDRDAWERHQIVEKAETDSIKAFAETWRNLPQKQTEARLDLLNEGLL